MNEFFTWLASNGNIERMVAWLIAGALAYNNIRWRLKNLEDGHNGLKEIVKDQVKVTHEVELNSAELKQIAKATERRLQLIEDRQSDRN